MGRLVTRKKVFFIGGLYFLIMGLFFASSQCFSSLSVIGLPQYTISFFVNPKGGGTINPSGTQTFYCGEAIFVDAEPAKGYGWVGWSTQGNVTEEGVNEFIINGNGNITANFEFGGSTHLSGLTPVNPLSILLDIIFFPHFIFESIMIVVGNAYEIAIFPTYEFILDTAFVIVGLFFFNKYRKIR
jgi:hypothetical protein